MMKISKYDNTIHIQNQVFDVKDFVSFLGIYCSRGCLKFKRRLTSDRELISEHKIVKLGGIPSSNIDKIPPLLQRMNLNFKKIARVFEIRDCDYLYDFLKDFGKEKHRRIVPKFLFGMEEEYLYTFLCWFNTCKNEYPDQGVKYKSYSPDLTNDLKKILAKLHIKNETSEMYNQFGPNAYFVSIK